MAIAKGALVHGSGFKTFEDFSALAYGCISECVCYLVQLNDASRPAFSREPSQ